MAQVGYDTSKFPGYVVLTQSSYAEHLTAGEADALADKLRAAANTVRTHNRPKKQLGDYNR